MAADPSKVGKSNVRKGKTYERRVAGLLTEYTGQEFRRRRVEGRDLSVVERESTADVIPVSAEIIFSIEAKSGKGFSFDALLGNQKKSIFTIWWHQATYDADILTKVLDRKIHPLLFFKYTTTQDWVAFPTDAPVSLRDGMTIAPQLAFKYTDNKVSLNVSHTSKKKNHVEVELDLPNVTFMRWRDFFTCIEPESIFYKN